MLLQTFMRTFFCGPISSLLGIDVAAETLGQTVTLCLTVRAHVPKWLHYFYSHQPCMCHPGSCNLTVAVICVSVMTNEAEHHSMWLLAMGMSSLEKYLFKFLWSALSAPPLLLYEFKKVF